MSEQRMDNSRERGDMVDKLIGVRRVAKTVKGGRRMAFGALVVVGDESGRVGWGKGKAREVPDAVRKATDEAKRAMVRVPLRQGRTIHHEVHGRFGSTRVILKPAVPGTGIIAGGPMRAVFEAMGIKDVIAKALGSTNPYNMIQATFDAFASMETPRNIAAKRGLKVTDLVLHKEEASKGETDQKELNEAAAKATKKPVAKKAAPAKGRGGKPEGDRKPRRDDKKAEAPKVQAVSKSDSMKAAIKAEPKADAAPAAEAPAVEAPKAE
ncbi:MAG: 30S ribosomal protein S5 [Pseudomonadaceae bacterium]|nr:30S ribosomal protein S5 [Pseudomonadaceae bacterium]